MTVPLDLDFSSPRAIATSLLSGHPLAILIVALITFTLPVLLHLWVFFDVSSSSPSALRFGRRGKGPVEVHLLGPGGSGKTAFVAQLLKASLTSDSPSIKPTHTTQSPSSHTLPTPSDVTPWSMRFRSANDTETHSSRNKPSFVIHDTPGHGKLRGEHALAAIQRSLAGSTNTSKPAVAAAPAGGHAVIYMVDGAGLVGDTNGAALRDAAGYLFDLLVVCVNAQRQQNARLKNKNKKKNKEDAQMLKVLIAVNKQDLFTALPAESVRGKLEEEIERTRASRRRRGRLVGDDEDGAEDDEFGLGEGEFGFAKLRDVGVEVDVLGGAVAVAVGEGGEKTRERGTKKWEDWIGSCL